MSSGGAGEGEHRGVDELFDWLPEDDVEGPDTGPRSSSKGSARPGGPAGEKLQKVLARSGLASRRVCEELIDGGRVTVNGEVARQGMRVDAEHDVVEVDGAPVGVAPGLVYYLLNKPAGVVSTAHDPQQRRTVVQMVPDHQRVYPVGRLDTDTEGLLVLTNDGPLTQRLTHPSFGVEKEYLAEVSGEPSPGALRLLRVGVELDDGVTAAARVALVDGAANHPRGPQPSGAADARSRWSSRGPPGPDPHRPDHRPAPAARRMAGAERGRGSGPGDGRHPLDQSGQAAPALRSGRYPTGIHELNKLSLPNAMSGGVRSFRGQLPR